MQQDDAGEVEAIADAIADYLGRHALAADSPGGVARWWLGPAHAGVGVDVVERALELLVARGVARRVDLTDGSFLYSLASPTRQ